MTPADKRSFSRVETRHRVVLSDASGCEASGWLLNVSMNGILVECRCPWQEGVPCLVKICLSSNGDGVLISMKGKIVRGAPGDRCAVEFTEICDPDSYFHLRNLVLYNAKDPEIVESEIETHSGIRRGDS
jgi:hypothetical protein